MSASLRNIAVEPGWLYRSWWIWTEPARLIIRLVVERWLRRSNWMLLFTTVRLAAHLAIGNLWWSVLVVLMLATGGPLAVAAALGLLVELVLKIASRRAGRPHRLVLWRAAWKFHRQWPRVWADISAKTREIQSFDGNSRGESRAAAIRPVVDHPRMPWRFWVAWPVITFRVGVAPGRTFAQFEQVISAMAANMAWIHAVELEYPTDRSSFGLLHVALGDVLAKSGKPGWVRRQSLRVVDDGEVA